jgi:hypothetical protein
MSATMMKAGALALALTGAVLAGCASTGARQVDDVQAYCAKQYADPRLDPIRSKVVLPISMDAPQPIEILADRTYPSASERQAIGALGEVRKACSDYAAVRMGEPPAYRQRSQGEVSIGLSQLYDGEITYGDFARRMLFNGERDKLAREDLEREMRRRDRFANSMTYE